MQVKFAIIAPMFNASKTLQQFLHSLLGQSHKNWRLILIDDCSTPDEQLKCERLLNFFGDSRFSITWNSYGRGKQWEVSNVLYGISQCEDDEIICRIDTDDFLCDLDAFRMLNEIYKSGFDCVWTAHRWFDDDNFTFHNISGPLADGVNPYKVPWVTSHLKTFRKSLLTGVADENFRGEDGEYIKRAGDQAIMLPAVHRAKKRYYLQVPVYAYRCNLSPATFQTDDAKFQKSEAEFIRRRGFIE